MKRILIASLFAVLVFLTIPQAQAALFSSDKDKTESAPKADNVYDYIRGQKNLGRFADMISSADLKDLFKNNSQPITVFAPTDDAIGDISGAIMKRIKASKENLQAFVKYHVIVGSRVGYNAINGRKSSAAAANGEGISFDGTSTKDPAKVNDGHLVSADAQVGNSFVHTISAALIPASLKEEPPAETKKNEKPAEPAPAPVVAPVDTTVPVATTLPTATTGKGAKNKLLPVGTAESAAPLGTTTLVPTSTAQPVVPPATTDTQKSGGFNFFGHHFGG